MCIRDRAEINEVAACSFEAMPRARKRHDSCSTTMKTQSAGKPLTDHDECSSQQQKPCVETGIRSDAVSTMITEGVRTSIGCVEQGDILSVRSDDKRWYAATVLYASTTRGIGLQYPESKQWKSYTEVLRDFDKEVTPDRVRKCETLDEANQQGRQPSLPINSGRIPDVGDCVEVEYDEADDGAPHPELSLIHI